METTPTPQQADELLAQVDASQKQARTHDSWPLVTMLFVLTAGISVGLVAIGIIDDDTTQLIIFGAGLAWLVPAMIVYLVKALSWSRRSTALLLTWLPLTVLVTLAAIITDSISPGPVVPLAAAAFLWIASPVIALIGLRR
ncbi:MULTISPECIES: hypothetical protein [unclassified Brevibacterium]|uniref:hypothetical protein n=1 Tax=unclassified Brevibacterium TaxID=2614124 RepID=UPI001081164B|nr:MULTISPECIES: hypothetical protein [unclassified Brevibacterium]TGD13664.1 hypothetical protein EB836_01310 [Brevibacterium sp. S111]TGD27984.1 hypothetical protein EB835_18040 [Brevibacterium sp. S22]